MAYYIDLFSPETFESFSKSDRTISGFRPRQEGAASRICPGDKLLCYMTKLSRWIGVLEVGSSYFKDETPILYESNDPFVIRFVVKPLVWLPKELAIPIHDDRVWQTLSFTRGEPKNSRIWTGKFRNSLNQIENDDGIFLEEILLSQKTNGTVYEVDELQYEKLVGHRVKGPEGEITVSVPTRDEPLPSDPAIGNRESIKVQALLADIGNKMGFSIWIPRNDRRGVLAELSGQDIDLVESLPLNYDDVTLKTIEQIDVLWLKRRSIYRAFEVEHTTSIYSGILRMADLLALQPNLDIKLHIVAPDERRDKVIEEIQRPVFSLLDNPLVTRCTFLSYSGAKEIFALPHLPYTSDGVLDEYCEEAETV